MRKLPIAFLFAVLLAPFAAEAQESSVFDDGRDILKRRVWKSADGKFSVAATYKTFDFASGSVVLDTGEKEIKVAPEKLDERSLDLLNRRLNNYPMKMEKLLKTQNAQISALKSKLDAATRQKNSSSKKTETSASESLILRATGSGQKNTNDFSLTGNPSVIVYDFKDSSGFGAGIFQVMVYRSSDRKLVSIVVNESGKSGNDSNRLRLDAGQYYLNVNAANCNWVLEVHEP